MRRVLVAAVGRIVDGAVVINASERYVGTASVVELEAELHVLIVEVRNVVVEQGIAATAPPRIVGMGLPRTLDLVSTDAGVGAMRNVVLDVHEGVAELQPLDVAEGVGAVAAGDAVDD